jgi:broad specificity phosphatase PhoE/predicted kinase
MGEYLYIIMVGLPARGKSTLAGKLSESLKRDGISTRIFNNGDLRRKLSKENTSFPEFYNPKNETGVMMREKYAVMNLNHAITFISTSRSRRKVAIIDATNVSYKRRRMLLSNLPEDNVLFIECINDDEEILEANIRYKADTPEFDYLSKKAAIASFKKRISYYEGIYRPLSSEKNFIKVDTFNYRVLKEKGTSGVPFMDRIRDFIVTPFIKNLYIIRHTETHFNVQDRIGGNSRLTPDGMHQAARLARHFSKKRLPLIFSSDLIRTKQTSEAIKKAQKDCRIIALPEFNEINSGVCEGMSYKEIREKRPEVAEARKKNKYYYEYPEGEGYVSMEDRIERGIKKVLYLSTYSDNIMIVGHRAVNRMILSYFVYKRKEDVPYIYIPQDRYYHIKIGQNRKVFEIKKFG